MKTIETNDLITCILDSKLDTHSALQLEKESVFGSETINKKVLLDFAEVIFISSYFLRIVLNLFKKVGAENFQVVNLRADIKKVFVISGYDKLFNIN